MHFQSLWLFLHLFLPWPEEKKVFIIRNHNQTLPNQWIQIRKRGKISDDCVCCNKKIDLLFHHRNSILKSHFHLTLLTSIYLSLLIRAVSVQGYTLDPVGNLSHGDKQQSTRTCKIRTDRQATRKLNFPFSQKSLIQKSFLGKLMFG